MNADTAYPGRNTIHGGINIVHIDQKEQRNNLSTQLEAICLENTNGPDTAKRVEGSMLCVQFVKTHLSSDKREFNLINASHTFDFRFFNI